MSRPFIPGAGVVSIELIYSQASIVMENQIHVHYGFDPNIDDLHVLRDVAIDWFEDVYRPGIANNLALVRVRTKSLASSDAVMEDYALPSAIFGTNSGGHLPPNATFCIKLATASAGRSARGRWYVAGLTSAQLSTIATVTTGFRDFVVDALNTLKDALSDASTTLVVASFRHDNEWREEIQTYDVTNFVAVDLNVDSQRRRLLGRGS